MTRFYLYFVILFAPILALLIIAMSALGSIQATNPALRGFVEGCEGIRQPCWYGIVVDASTLEDAETIFERLGYAQIGTLERQFLTSRTYRPTRTDKGCTIVVYYAAVSEPISEITFYDCDLLLGDLVAVYGAPDALHLRAWGEGEWSYDAVGLSIGFSNNFAPYTSFDRIIMKTGSAAVATSFDWHGYAPQWRYCQLEPELDLCS